MFAVGPLCPGDSLVTVGGRTKPLFLHRRDWYLGDLARRWCAALALILIFALLGASAPAIAASRLADFLPKAQPQEFFPEADRLGAPQGDPPIAPAFAGERLLGFVYLSSDFANAIGYSGKPIHVLVGIDPQGKLTAIKLVEHKEPIVLIGIPEHRIVEAMRSLVGRDMAPVASGADRPPQVDIVSGATVTVLVIGDSVVRSAVKLIRSGRIGPESAAAPMAAPPPRRNDLLIWARAKFAIGRVCWETARSDGCSCRWATSARPTPSPETPPRPKTWKHRTPPRPSSTSTRHWRRSPVSVEACWATKVTNA